MKTTMVTVHRMMQSANDCTTSDDVNDNNNNIHRTRFAHRNSHALVSRRMFINSCCSRQLGRFHTTADASLNLLAIDDGIVYVIEYGRRDIVQTKLQCWFDTTVGLYVMFDIHYRSYEFVSSSRGSI